MEFHSKTGSDEKSVRDSSDSKRGRAWLRFQVLLAHRRRSHKNLMQRQPIRERQILEFPHIPGIFQEYRAGHSRSRGTGYATIANAGGGIGELPGPAARAGSKRSAQGLARGAKAGGGSFPNWAAGKSSIRIVRSS